MNITKTESKSITRILPTIRKISPNASSVELLEDFLQGVGLRGNNQTALRSYRATCTDFLQFIGDLPIRSVRPRDIRDFLAWRYELKASNNTLARERYALGAFFVHMERLDIVSISPCRSVPIRKWRRKLPKTLTIEEIERLIDATDNPRDRAIIIVFYSTGCRLSELLGMRIENIQQGKHLGIRIVGKGDKERIVPLNGRAIEALKPVIGDRESGFIFQSPRWPQGNGSLCVGDGYWLYQWFETFESDGETVSRGRSRIFGIAPNTERAARTKGRHIKNGRRLEVLTREQAEAAALDFMTRTLSRTPRRDLDRPLYARTVWLMVAKTARSAGLGRVHPHMFRHSCATHLLDGGADILTIKEILGHESITTTTIYAHVSQKHIEETMRKFHPHWQEGK